MEGRYINIFIYLACLYAWPASAASQGRSAECCASCEIPHLLSTQRPCALPTRELCL